MLEINRRSVEIIGANIQIYGHFEAYQIPDNIGRSLSCKVSLEYLLKYIDLYYNSKTSMNYDYGDNLKEQNAVKRFIIKRINNSSYDVGVEWIKDNYNINIGGNSNDSN